MSRSRVCVVKIGGSLFSLPDVATRLQVWLRCEMKACPDTHYLLIGGGGALVNAVREMDRISPMDAVAAHWICVDLMDVTGRLIGAMLPDVTLVDRSEQIERRFEHPGATVFCPSAFLRHIEPTRPGTRLVANWSVTSDSIAARLAVVAAADELLLLKSVVPPIEQSGDLEKWVTDLATAGYVDSFLPVIAGRIAMLRFAALPALALGPRAGFS